MGLFKKKICDVCGEQIGMFGNNKLADGNLCDNCEKKLSPWFTGHRSSTIEQIQQQLAYREENQIAASQFNTTRSFGRSNVHLLMDEDAGTFCVTSAANVASANPDIINFSDVTACELDIDAREDEEFAKDKEGNRVSYNPKRYIYTYDFYLDISVNNPYFNKIRFKINKDEVELRSIVTGVEHATQTVHKTVTVSNNSMAGKILNAGQSAQGTPARGPIPGQRGPIPGQRGPIPGQRGPIPGQKAPAQPATTTKTVTGTKFTPGRGTTVTKPDPEQDIEYREFKDQGLEIRKVLLRQRKEARKEAAAQQTVQAVVCPWCGATTIPGPNGTCEYCGGALDA